MNANKFVCISYICNVMAMKQRIEILKGIHPGKIIARELQKRGISQRTFATSIGEHSQTLNAVITGRRHLTTEMAVKIEQALGYEECFLLILQAYYETAECKKRLAAQLIIGVPNVRRSLFWDTDFDTIDWTLYKEAAIQRICEHGNDVEKAEIAQYYHMPMSELNKYKPKNSYRIKK